MSSDAKREANARYLKKVDTISLRLPKGKKFMLQMVAAAQKKSVNSFICDAIDAEIERINALKP